MAFYPKKLLTIFTESILEEAIIDELQKFKIKGFTIVDARGVGGHGRRDAGWEGSKNIRIEAICSESTANALAEHLKKTYYENYAMVLYLSNVEVLRAEKF